MPTVIFHPARLHGSASVGIEKDLSGIHAGGEWSRAAVLLCANALGSGITVHGIQEPGAEEKPLQGDAQIVTILRQMGLLAYEAQNEWHVTSPSRAGLMPMMLSCTDIPGLARLLALVLSQAHGRSTLMGVRPLEGEDRARLIRAQELFCGLNAKVSLSEDLDTVTVEGCGRHPLHGGFAADAQGDPWVVLLLSIAALIADAPITVTGTEALEGFWPSYLKTYQSLGGQLRQEDGNDR